MRRSLVTGGAGFIGSHVAAELLRRGHRVTVVDDLSGGFIRNVPGGARFIKGDVTRRAFVGSLFRGKPFDYVFHLAAYAAEGLSHYIRGFNYANNLLGSVHLVNASVNSRVKAFVFTSSIAVYGASDVLPVTEETPLRPQDPYGIAKLAVEQDLACARALFGLPYIIFRPHNVYGERQNIGDNYRNVVGIFMNRILEGRPMPVFGDGRQRRAFTYIGDVAPVIARSVDVKGAFNQVFNIGADEDVSVAALAGEVARAMGVAPRVERLPARHEVRHVFASHAKLRKTFRLAGSTPRAEGLQAMAAWVKRHGVRRGKPFEGVEVRLNFPEAWKKFLKS